MVPNKDSYCEIDPTVVDKWGIPVLRFHFKFSDYEYNQAKHMQETFRAIITEMGGTPMTPMPTAAYGYGIEAGGHIIHEAGTTRMGNDPSTSVLNKNCQAHDARKCSSPTAGRSCRRRTRTDLDHPGARDADSDTSRNSGRAEHCKCSQLPRTQVPRAKALPTSNLQLARGWEFRLEVGPLECLGAWTLEIGC